MRRLRKNSSKLSAPDYGFLLITGFLLLIGLFMLASAGSAVGYQKFGDSYYFVKRQIMFGLLPGLGLFFFFAKVNFQKWKNYMLPLLIATLLLLIIVFIPGIGQDYGKARSWINFFGYSLQPSEIVKLTFLLYLANWVYKQGESKVKDFKYGFLLFCVILGAVSFLMIMQPDMGTMMVIVAMSIGVYFAGGGKLTHLFLLIGGGFATFLTLIKISPYRAARLTTFLHPELDPQGIGYHINQAFLAIGSGGWWGRGFGHSRQKFLFLPEVTGDSIFAVIGEEIGFILAAGIVVLFLLFALRGLKIAQNCNDDFGKYIAVGAVCWITFQAFCNISAMIGLMPITGIPLPFISHGGTAMMSALAAVGLMTNISRHAKT